MSNRIHVIGNMITFPNGRSQVYQFEIEEYVIIDNLIFILFGMPVDFIYNRNVVSFNFDGEKIWQIEECQCEGGGFNCRYSGIFSEENSNKLRLYNTSGFSLLVDPYSGEILEREFTK